MFLAFLILNVLIPSHVFDSCQTSAKTGQDVDEATAENVSWYVLLSRPKSSLLREAFLSIADDVVKQRYSDVGSPELEPKHTKTYLNIHIFFPVLVSQGPTQCLSSQEASKKIQRLQVWSWMFLLFLLSNKWTDGAIAQSHRC